MCSRLWNDRKCVECAFNLKLSALSGGFVYLNLAGGDGDLDVRAPSCAVHQRRASIHYSLEKPTYFPTKFSSTELFPALCPPTTAICGRSRFAFCPMAEKASCMRFTRGIKSSIPRFPIFARGWWASFLDRTGTDIWLYLPLRPSSPPLRAFRGRSSLRALTGSLLALLPHLRCSSVCQIISSQHSLQHSPLQAPQGGRRRMSSCILPGDPCSTPHPPLGGDTGRFLSHK